MVNMKVVIDTSAIIAVLLNEPEKDSIVELTSGVDLISPHSVHWEVGNAFSAMLKRKRISLKQTSVALSIYYTIPIQFVDVDIEQALNVAYEMGIYAYDAYVILCSESFKSPILSLDKALTEVARKTGKRIVEVS